MLWAALAVGGCTADGSAPASEGGSGGPPATLVRVAEVRSGALETELRVPAEVQAVARSQLASGADGAVVRVDAEVGDRVTAGQVLVRVDDRLPRARVEVARAQLEQARAEAELAAKERDRIEQLKPGIVSDLERDRARAEATVARARVAAAEAAVAERSADLAQFLVRAPYDGFVAVRRVDPGTWVQPGQLVMDVVSADQVELIVDGSRVLAGRVAPGDAATIHAPGGELKGRVTGVVPALDPVSRTLRIRVLPADGAPPHALVAGDAIDVGFSVQLAEEGVLVTTDALLERPDETRIFEIEAGTAADSLENDRPEAPVPP